MDTTTSTEIQSAELIELSQSETSATFRETVAKIEALIAQRSFAHSVHGRYLPLVVKKMAEGLLGQTKKRLQVDNAWIEAESKLVGDILSTCIVVLDYFDDLTAPGHLWVSKTTEHYYKQLVGTVKREQLQTYFQLALIHLHVEYRRRPSELLDLSSKFEAIERHLIDLYSLNSAPAYSVARHYYDLRAQLARQTSERYEADRFIDLASGCADMELRLDPQRAHQTVDEKFISIGLTKVWLQIAKGHYRHALHLLELVQVSLSKYENDPITRAKYLVARNVCRRALAGKDLEKLEDVIVEMTEALHIFDELEDRRHLLRCYHELSLCFLLLGRHNKVSGDLKFMREFAHAAGKNRSVGWQIQYCLMESRLACQRENFETAKAKAEEAVTLSTKAGMELLAIESRNTLAMVLFRTNELTEAQIQLQDALRLNHDDLTQADHGDLSQTALLGVSLLYLARVSLLQNDRIAALRAVQKWRKVSGEVEHQWVKNLAVEVEHQFFYQCLIEEVDIENGPLDFSRQLLLLRKTSIERASRKLKSTKIADIARELNVKRQTIYTWIKELDQQQMTVLLN